MRRRQPRLMLARIRALWPVAIAAAGLAAFPAGAVAETYELDRIVPFGTRASESDDTALRGDVYLPAKAGPLATVLGLSPYWNTAAKGPGEAQAESEAVKPFVQAGFAVALVNLRGTGESDGCFQFGSRVDWSDSYAVVEALADEPWSNGSIGMYGTSYEGWTQFMAMGAAPPSLEAAVPISGVIDLWDLLTRQGAPISIGPVTGVAFGGLTSFGTTFEPSVADHVGCPEFAEHAEQGAELVTTGDRTDYYASRDLRPRIEGSNVPVLLANGLRYFDEGHELQFEGLWDLLQADRTRFMLGQWGHGGTREDFNELAVGWFDHYLRGGPEVTEPGLVEYQDDAGRWHTTNRWPPRAEAKSLYLSEDDLVLRRSAVNPSQRSFQSSGVDTFADAADVVSEGETGDGGIGPACGPHEAIYVSPPLADDVLVAGNFSVDLSVTSDLPGGNLVATLYHTPGDGSCADVLSQGGDSSRVQLDLRHTDEPGKSRDFPTNTRTEVVADSLPLATAIPAGERLVLAIGAGSAEIEPDPLQPRITIDTGPSLPGSLSLPVAAGELRFAR